MFSRNFKLSFYFILLLGLISSSFAICLDSPSFIKVSSGGNALGEFDSAYLNSPELIYVKSDLDNNPIKVDFYFENIENDCFTSQDDVQMRLFSSGILVSSDSILTQGTQTIAKFEFDVATVAPSSFNSNYIIKNKNNALGTEDIIKFGTDDEAPNYSTLVNSPNDVLILPNTSVSVNYAVIDSKSKLDFLRIIGGTTSIINFDGENETYSHSFTETLSSSRNYQFTVRDKLGNENNKNITYVVDGSGPVFSNFNVESYTRNELGTRKVTFSVDIQDISYTVDNTLPVVVGNFTSINSIDLAKEAVCTREDSSKYTCLFEDVDITLLNQTTTLPFNLNSVDVLGNSNSQNFNKEIFYDTKGPSIDDFYLLNSKGEKNIFNAFDTTAKIVVKFTDESAETKTDIRLFPSFDGIETFLISNCDNISNNVGTCYWNLDNTLSKYSGTEVGNVVYELTLIDVYGNPTTETLNLTINNEKPEITLIELVETTDIKDSIVNSGEKINFKVFIKDSNLIFEEDFIYGDFSSIDFRDGMDTKSASCNYYNQTLIQCDFTAIIVENGYMKRNVSFFVSDTAGNTLVEDFEVEIFAIGDEVFSSFKISDIIVTNSLDRFVIKNVGLDAWFEGEIDLQDESSNIKIVNYQLKSCNDSQMNPVLLGERNLYPSNVVVPVEGAESADNNFIVKVEVNTHPNYEDLETNKMMCTMAILKRDDTQIYPPELVEFNLQFEYFNLPYDNLLSANAANIMAMIDDAEFLGSWFDTIYDIYKIFDSLCGVIGTANGVLSGIGNVIYGTQWMLASTKWVDGGAMSNAIGKAGYTPGNIVGELFSDYASPIKMVCDFVTCRNGGILGSFWSGQFPGLTENLAWLNSAGGLTNFGNVCSDDINKKSTTPSATPEEYDGPPKPAGGAPKDKVKTPSTPNSAVNNQPTSVLPSPSSALS